MLTPSSGGHIPSTAMQDFLALEAPPQMQLLAIERNAAGETNTVLRCQARIQGQRMEAYLKIAKGPRHSLANERDILGVLSKQDIPVPEVLYYQDSPVPFLLLEALPGRMVWDFIDPRRERFEAGALIPYLRSYGRTLARIHQLPISWPPQKRGKLYGLLGEEQVPDRGFPQVVSWVRSNTPERSEDVFVHGDLNTASLLFLNGKISGIVDWEFAGCGWREYDLAWILRARRAFLNTGTDRNAILDGYRELGNFDEASLQWCEVLNYLHFAYWSRNGDPDASSFSLQRAQAIAGLSGDHATLK